jgi:hypothetical protein
LSESGFAPLVALPLLIPHVRDPGGRGGRRITAGRLDGSNAALRDAGRAGLTSRPVPAALILHARRSADRAL